DLRSAGNVVRRRNHAAFDWRHSERLQHSAAYVRSGQPNRLRLAGKVRTSARPGIKRCPGMGVAAQIKKFRGRGPEAMQSAVRKSWKLRVNTDELLGVLIR